MIDATDPLVRVRCAAFEAAYLEMASPDPASPRFALLVARHRERLWAEHLAGQGGPAAAALTGQDG